MTDLGDWYWRGEMKIKGHEIERLRAENKRLRAALNEIVTNGQWTEGEQRGDWAITKEVYETARAALAGEGGRDG